MSEHQPKGPVGTRREVGDADSSQRHPPHVDQNAEEAEFQEDHLSPGDIPSMPATAHGEDESPSSEHPRTVDPESAYENRPEEHKDISP